MRFTKSYLKTAVIRLEMIELPQIVRQHKKAPWQGNIKF